MIPQEIITKLNCGAQLHIGDSFVQNKEARTFIAGVENEETAIITDYSEFPPLPEGYYKIFVRCRFKHLVQIEFTIAHELILHNNFILEQIQMEIERFKKEHPELL
jgi:hypothetical protein